jgi:hypothetical protein
MDKTKLSSIISSQFPEFTIPKYGNFIKFLELYYSYIEQTDFRAFGNLKSLDDNLDVFVEHIKSELGISDIPSVHGTDERLLLKHIKDFYSAKGSEESLRILFRHLFGKEIDIFYPKDFILKASDGRWKQEISVLVSVSSNDKGISTSWLNDKTYQNQTGSISTSKSSTIVTGYNTQFTHLQKGSILHKTDTNIIIGTIYSIQSDTILTLVDHAYIDAISAIQFKTSVADAYSLTGKYVNIQSTYKTIEVYVSRVRAVNNGQYEIFMEGFYHNDLELYNEILFEDVLCVIQPSVAKLRVEKKGAKFKLGQIFDLDAGGSGAKCKIVDIDADGGIKSIQLIFFGSGYEQNSYFNLVSGFNKSETFDPSKLYDYTTGFVEDGVITYQDYFVEYAPIDYSGEVLRAFHSDYTVPPGYYVTDDNTAIIEIEMGIIRKYPGSFTASNGFASDAFVLQDNYYYQIYSYAIKVSEDIQLYKDIVKHVVNPAGYLMFGEYTLNNDIDMSISLEQIGYFFKKLFKEILLFTDDHSTLIEKPFADSVGKSDSRTKLFGKALADSITNADSSTKLFNKGLTDYVTQSENRTKLFGKALADSITAPDSRTKLFGKALADSITAPDSRTKLFGKALADSITNADSSTKLFNKGLSETITYTETKTTAFSKQLADAITPSQTFSKLLSKRFSDSTYGTTDTGSLILTKIALSYFLEDYNSQAYAEGTYTTNF